MGRPGPGRDKFFTLPYTELTRALLYNVPRGDMSQGRRDSFVVRVSLDRSGQLTGVVERVATGAKQTFTGVDAIGTVIACMLAPTLRPVPSPTAVSRTALSATAGSPTPASPTVPARSLRRRLAVPCDLRPPGGEGAGAAV